MMERVQTFPIFAMLVAGFVASGVSLHAATPPPTLEQYLPAGVSYDPSIPKPRDILGFEVGEWHVRHDLLVAYMRALAEASPRVRIEETGRTYESRPLVVLTISDPANLARSEAIRSAHLDAIDPSQPATPPGDRPVVVSLGYSVHGDEASGSNASLVVAYHLAAAQDEATKQQLRQAIVLLDPSFNPDGLGRFAQWVNTHKGQNLVADRAHREHNQAWPPGRTNHYWFDLNRDYITGQHPETRARLATFHRWRPNVYTDHHEMGTDATFFFQPGVPSRKHPLTPEENVTLTEKIAGYHARAFDQQGRLYYSKESFDDFYYGKGSTYPDIHGAIGILFEQASSRGHLQESINGPLAFPFGIQNQVTTSFSTLAAAVDMREQLLDYQARFFRDALDEARDNKRRGWIFGDDGDPARAAALIAVLQRHQIAVRPLARALETDDGATYEPGAAWIVEGTQAQARLAEALFEVRTTFPDSTFYDVSTWTLPLAFGLPFSTLGAADLEAAGPAVGQALAPTGEVLALADDATADSDEAPAAWAFEWHHYYAPRALYRLQDAGVHARVATAPFEAQTGQGARQFDYGTIVIPRGMQEDVTDLPALLTAVARDNAIDVYALGSGLSDQGIDLGSPRLIPLEQPKIALIVGRGVSMYEAGAAWHLLDHRFDIPVTLLEHRMLGNTSLDTYSHLVMVDGGWDRLSDDALEAIRSFVHEGGGLVAIKRAASWAGRNVLAAEDEPSVGSTSDEEPPETTRRPYGSYRADRAIDLVSGAIFEVSLDRSHPLAFGYRQEQAPVFRNYGAVLEHDAGPYTTVAQYTAEPLLSGYASTRNIERIAGSPALLANRMGEGLIVRMVDDPNFRAFWFGTNKLFLNTLFLGPVVRPTP